MNDIDFDELHKAVNEVMGSDGKPKAKKVKAATHTKKSEEARHAPAAEPEKTESPKPVESKAEQVAVRRPLPKLATHQRARGIAMDIVQPKTPPPTAPPSARPARTSANIQPAHPIQPKPPEEPVEASAPTVPEPSDDMLASINMDESKHHVDMLDGAPNPHASQWPDPLEVGGFKDDHRAAESKNEPKKSEDSLKNEKSAVVAVPEPEVESSASIKTKNAELASEPSKEPTPSIEPSPFVSTNVEKRPLGAYTNTSPAVASPELSKSAQSPAEEVKAPEAEEPTTKKDEQLDEPQPAQQQELSPEVVAVESQEPEFTPGLPRPKTQAEETTDLHSVSRMEIPKQYQEAEREPSAEERPVFDTKEYHPPIVPAHAAHRTGSPWGVVMIVILLLLLVGAGLLAYFIMTGTLDITRWL